MTTLAALNILEKDFKNLKCDETKFNRIKKDLESGNMIKELSKESKMYIKRVYNRNQYKKRTAKKLDGGCGDEPEEKVKQVNTNKISRSALKNLNNKKQKPKSKPKSKQNLKISQFLQDYEDVDESDEIEDEVDEIDNFGNCSSEYSDEGYEYKFRNSSEFSEEFDSRSWDF